MTGYDRPWRAWAVYAFLTGALYALATQTPARPPLVIEPSRIDALVPFVPAAAYVYVTYALLLPVLIVLAARRQGFAEIFATVMGCGLANALLYNVVPSRIAERTAAPPGSLLAVIQNLDTTLAAIPSGHVALPAAIATAACLVGRRGATDDEPSWNRIAAGFAVWTAALAASALLTKQHFAVDVAVGLVFGLSFAALSSRVIEALNPDTGAAIAREWLIIAVAVAAAVRWWSAPVIATAALVIATRQHALLALYHDGVHGLIARGRRLNDFVANLAVGVPLLLPIHIYRALHLSHHHHLGEESDPERVLLYRGQPWQFRPLAAGPLARQLAGDVLAWNGIATSVRYFRESAKGGALRLPSTRWYPELVGQYVAVFGALAWAFVLWPPAATRAVLVWFIPYVTVTQLLQKIRSFAEHTTADVDESLACSWSPGLLGRLTIWPYNINYHREHHGRPETPWNRLPVVFPAVQQRPGRQLLSHLWKGATS
jgi:fatty acid desaturase